MAKFSRPFLIERRVAKLAEKIKVDTQKLREKLLKMLEAVFDEAVQMARGQVMVDGRELTIKQRQAWARVAAYAAQVMQGVAKGLDEKEIDVQLIELQRMVHEAKAKKNAGRTG